MELRNAHLVLEREKRVVQPIAMLAMCDVLFLCFYATLLSVNPDHELISFVLIANA